MSQYGESSIKFYSCFSYQYPNGNVQHRTESQRGITTEFGIACYNYLKGGQLTIFTLMFIMLQEIQIFIARLNFAVVDVGIFSIKFVKMKQKQNITTFFLRYEATYLYNFLMTAEKKTH
ncbi:hypothetical protein ACJX0J_013799, partial [Zea mays]